MQTFTLTRFPVTIDGDTVDIGAASELAAALDVLQGQHDREVLEQLRPHLADVIGGPADLIAVLKSLSHADQVFLIEALGDRLTAVINNARSLSDVFAMMSTEEVESAILNTLGADGLRALIHTPEELGETLSWLYGRNDKKVLDMLGADYLRKLTRTGAGLALVLNALEITGQKALLDTLGWEHVMEGLHTVLDLTHLLRAMPAEVGSSLIDALSPQQLQFIIDNARNWEHLWHRLEPAEAQALAQKLQLNDHAA